MMLPSVLGMFSYAFMVRAAVVGVLVSLCAALLGVGLVLKRFSMIGDGLSHVGFGALAVAMALNLAPLAVAVPVVVAAAFLLLRLSDGSGIKGDAAIAVISTGALAIGVLVISASKGLNADVYGYLFGSILTMSGADVYLSCGLAAAVLALYAFFYNRIFAVAFDETFAKAAGVNTGAYNALTALLTAITIVLGMRMMGAMLISSLIIFPALSAMRVFKRFGAVVMCSGILSVLCFLVGFAASYAYSAPVGASVVAANIAALLAFGAIGSFIGRKWRKSASAVHDMFTK